jgi:hypothetical protein
VSLSSGALTNAVNDQLVATRAIGIDLAAQPKRIAICIVKRTRPARLRAGSKFRSANHSRKVRRF